MAYRRQSKRERTGIVVIVAVLHAAAAWFLLTRMPPRPMVADEPALVVFDVPPPLPSVPAALASQSARSAGAAAPAHEAAVPARVAAPTPLVPPPLPTLPAPPLAGTGTDTAAGAAPIPGPGTGAGGTGLGSGSGSTGNGTGGGSPARLTRGTIVDRDYPAEARRAHVGGSVTVRFTVGTDGRASGCAVVRSSGTASLDTTTCRLIEQRFRYTPARDAAGRAVAEERGWRQDWWLDRPGGPPGGG